MCFFSTIARFQQIARLETELSSARVELNSLKVNSATAQHALEKASSEVAQLSAAVEQLKACFVDCNEARSGPCCREKSPTATTS